MPQPTLGAEIKLSGEKEFKQALSEINAGLRVNKSEMELVTAQYSKNANSVEALTAKGDVLERQISSQTEQISVLEQALKSSADKYGESDKKTMDWQSSLNKAKTELVKLTSAQEENKKALEKVQGSLSEYNQEVGDTTEESNKFGSMSSSIFKKLGVDANNAEQDASSSLMKYVESLSGTGEKAGIVSDIIGSALEGAPVAGAAAAVGAILKICEAANEAANEVEWSADRIQVALGFTEEEAKEAAESVKRIYKVGLADSKDEAQSALVAVTKLMGVQGEEAEILTHKVLAISKGYSEYGADISSTARTASTLMRTFGITSEEAFDIITAGFQNNASDAKDMLDTVKQYSSSFERMGFSAQEMLTMINSAVASGGLNADKTADIVKEFYNKAASHSTDFGEALKQLGFNSEQTMRQLTSGGDTAQAAFEKVWAKLSNITDESKRSEIASKLIGSQWEDVGTKATLALANTKNKLIDTTGATEKAFETLANSGKTIEENFDRTTKDAAQFAGPQLLNAIIPGIQSNLIALKSLFKKNSEETNKELIEGSKKSKEAGIASSKEYENGWKSNEKSLLGTIKISADTANKILGSIGSNGKSNSSSSSSKIPPYALGTSYHSGGFARVNDRLNDPYSGEVIDLPTGSRVYPAGKHPQGNVTYNITIDAKNVREFTDLVRMAQGARQQRRVR